MEDVLTTAAKLRCGPAAAPPLPGHAAIGVTSEAVLKVKGKPVLLESSFLSPGFQCANPDSAGGLCTKFILTAGASTVLKVNNEPVVLATIAATITLAGTLIKVDAGQSILHVRE
ncbi:hypothetical protein [Nocardia altamirensis]|uniref:hypothetical protein n=1 Tax=Nocardia altamirensis TaxID=472158 RepID=UPI00083FEAFA|nr:hypothetical protein [Nocardia altamirensis]